MNWLRRFGGRLGRWYHHPHAPLVAYAVIVVLVVAGMTNFAWTLGHFEDDQREADRFRRELTATQRQINIEQRGRTVAVCDALVASKNDLRRALETLIDISTADGESDPERTARVELFRQQAIAPLETPPPECEDVREPLPSGPTGGQ